MARYFARSCPRCGGYVGITMRESPWKAPVQAVNGRCVGCSYRMAWLVLKGNKPPVLKNSAVRSR